MVLAFSEFAREANLYSLIFGFAIAISARDVINSFVDLTITNLIECTFGKINEKDDSLKADFARFIIYCVRLLVIIIIAFTLYNLTHKFWKIKSS